VDPWFGRKKIYLLSNVVINIFINQGLEYLLDVALVLPLCIDIFVLNSPIDLL